MALLAMDPTTDKLSICAHFVCFGMMEASVVTVRLVSMITVR